MVFLREKMIYVKIVFFVAFVTGQHSTTGDPNVDSDVGFTLVQCGIRDAQTVLQMSEDDKRNTLIQEVNKRTSSEKGQGLKNSGLIREMENCSSDYTAKQHGGNFGPVYTVICPDSGVITGIAACSGWVMDHISFTCTSLVGISSFGPFGGSCSNGSKSITYNCPANQYISAFYGKAGTFLDQVGVHCRNSTDLSSRGVTPSDGVFGGNGGADYDDISYSFGRRPIAIQIFATTLVVSIRVTYGDLKINLCAYCNGVTQLPIVTEKPKPPIVTEIPKQKSKPAGSNNTNEANCGNRPASFRIVNGREAAPNSWPWMVSILEVDDEESKHICGGTLIAPSTILTAAHCFKFKTESSVYKIRLGSHKLSETGAHEVERQVTSLILHEKYVKLPASAYDIAILTLDSAVEFNDFVSPLCLGKPLQLLPGVSCYVIGWGKTQEHGDFSDVLLELELPILPRSECKKILADKFDPDLQICGAYENGGKDACQGDSGGPLVCEDKKADKWRLQGIVSWGKGCAIKGNPGVYTRVSYYKDWIMQHSSISRLKF